MILLLWTHWRGSLSFLPVHYFVFRYYARRDGSEHDGVVLARVSAAAENTAHQALSRFTAGSAHMSAAAENTAHQALSRSATHVRAAQMTLRSDAFHGTHYIIH